MKLTKPSYFYHLTNKKWRNEVCLRPMTCDDLQGCAYYMRTEEEPDIPKTCVSTTIDGCLCALPLKVMNYNIFRTKNKVKAAIPYGVADQAITQERWVIRPTKFIKIGQISSISYRHLLSYLYENDIDTSGYSPGNVGERSLQQQREIACAIRIWWNRYGKNMIEK